MRNFDTEADGSLGSKSEADTTWDARGAPVLKQPCNITVEGVVLQDAVFGDIADGGPNYRGLGWIRTAVLMIKAQIGLGVLGIPSILITLGLIPGIIIILVVAVIATFTAHVVGTFKAAHPEVYSMADIGQLIAGPIGREFMGGIYFLMLTSIAGAGMLGVATAFNAITDNGTCSIVFTFVGAVLTFAVSSIRTLDRISWIGWVGLIGILGAVITLAIATGLQDRPSAAPQVGPWDPQVILFGSPSFLDAMTAVSTIIFSFAGIPNFVNILAEMRRPQDYPKSLAVCQSIVLATYLIIGCIVYHFCGIYVSSPALGSAGVLLKKVTYGIALPGLVVGCVLNTHMPAKYIFLRAMKRSEHLNSSGWQHWTIWLSCVAGCTIFSFLIAEAIPFFGDLVGLIGALFATWFTFQTGAIMWLFENRLRLRTDRSVTFLAIVAFCALLLVTGSLCVVGGTVSSIIAINNSIKSGTAGRPFAC